MSTRIKLITYAQQNGFTSASKVRKNASGYPFITLVDKNNAQHSENLYLAKEYGEGVQVGQALPINDLYVADTTNATGEQRFKITDKPGTLTEAKAAEYTDFA